MLSITNNQQTPIFQQRAKMAESSQKVVKYLWDKGINPNHLLSGGLFTTGGTAAVSYANPNLIAAPDSAKFGVLGGLASTLGAMFTSTRQKDVNTGKQNDLQNSEQNFLYTNDLNYKQKIRLEKEKRKTLRLQYRLERRQTRFSNRQATLCNSTTGLTNCIRWNKESVLLISVCLSMIGFMAKTTFKM